MNIKLLYSKKWKIIILSIIFYLPKLLNDIKCLLIPYLLSYEYKKIENYLKLCSSSEYLDMTKDKPSSTPKISIVSPVYNTGKFVLRLLKSIQYQNFKDFELILIDDFSKDESVELIEKCQKYDKRIRLLKNKANKGTFASRNFGILKSKGLYIMMPDPDDILLENSLRYFYYFSIKHNYELIRFNVYLKDGKTFFFDITKNLDSRPIYQPELSSYIFYGLGFLKQVDYNVCNKFIKREALIRSLNNFERKDLNMFMTCHEDGLLNYNLYRKSKSLYFLKKFGYYYIRNNYKKRRPYYTFNNLKYSYIHIMNVFNNSKNTEREKDMTNEIFNRLIYKKRIKKRLNLINKEYNFFIDVINTLNENEFFKIKYKKYLFYFLKYFSNKTI